MNESPNSRFMHLYAVIRVDFPVGQEFPENNISVTKIFSSHDEAESEAERVRSINSGKDCKYFVSITRFVR